MRCNLRHALATLTGLALGACGGMSDVGDQPNDDAPPVASIVVLNQAFSRDTAGKVATRVRSGSEVFLSGKDSDGTVAPVLKFEWQMLTQGGAASDIRLVTRNASTVSFTAPPVPQDTTLQLRLTVTDANGRTAQKDVDVAVVAVPDVDHFLVYGLDSAASRKLRLVATTSSEVTPAQLQGLADVEFEITVQRSVDYTTPGTDGPYLPLATERFTGRWLAGFGASTDCADPRNPVFEVTKPALDIDDILAAVDPTRLDTKPNPARIDDYQLRLQATIRVVGGALPSGVEPQICAPDVPDAAAPVMAKWGTPAAARYAKRTSTSGSLDLDLPEVLGDASETQDTLASAKAYYAAIDPDRKRTTFIDWLKETGFLARNRDGFSWAELQASSTAHAVYTNNFDLGFGRDMYARVIGCSDGPVPPMGQPIDIARRGQCDIAAVVVNYSSLEGATKKLNPMLAVAMEYAVTPASNGRRIVQFYTFAPDLVTGRFERVHSANLDGRGEKYLPQVCTVCHGGAPGGLDDGAYVNAGDVGAAFLPWDLDSFLFADADGANSDRSFTDESQRSRYTRAAQADSLRKLNQIAYLTFDDTLRPTRYALLAELVEGWYGSQSPPPARAFVDTTFDGRFTPAGWSANGADGVPGSGDENPASAETLYHDVFARNCRACHVAHVAPETTAGGTLCERLTPVAGATRPAVPHQLPIACYRQFVAEPALANRLSNAEMPFARLTMDRFWVAGAGGASAADNLIAHLAQLTPPVVAGVPGEPRADFSFTAQIDDDHPDLDVDSAVDLAIDPAGTKFADALQWSVEHCAAPGLACTTVAVAGGTSPAARFVVPQIGAYSVSLTAATRAGRVSAPVVKTFSVAGQDPQIDLGELPATLQLGGAMVVQPTVTLGNGSRAAHRYWLSGLENLRFTAGSRICDSHANSCGLDEAMSLESIPAVPASGTFSLSVADASGPAVVGSHTVELTTGLSPTTTAIRIRPNADAIIDFAEGVTVPEGEVLGIQILSGPTAANVLGSAELLGNPGDRVRTYRPPPRYANYDSVGMRHGDAEVVGFRLLRRRIADDQIVEQRDFSREIRIEATTRFQTHVLAQVLRRTGAYPSGSDRVRCDSCHANLYADDLDEAEVYQNVLSRVDLARPDDSPIVCWPAVTCAPGGHAGLDRDPGEPGGADDDMAPIRAWIEEGANRF